MALSGPRWTGSPVDGSENGRLFQAAQHFSRLAEFAAISLGNTLYSFVRSIDTSPHFLVSEDDGTSWALGGRLTSTPQVGYVAGYYNYWGNNSDRIDFFGTEAHPRDNDNSLYHGYIKDGQIYNSTGQVV